MNLLKENWNISDKPRYNCPLCGVETKKAWGSDPLLRQGQICRNHRDYQRNQERKKTK
jgi:hypothetical protein